MRIRTFALLAVLTAACHRSGPPRVATEADGTITAIGSMSGTVVDAETSAGVEGALVSLVPDKSFDPTAESTTGYTEAGGQFLIKTVHAGRYFVDVGRKGYKGASATIRINPGQLNSGNRFKISPTSTTGLCPKTLAGKPNPLCP